jgi:serine protease AprX
MKHETPFRRSRMTAALGLLAALFTLAPAAHAAAVPQELTDAAAADPAASFDVLVDSSTVNGTANAATTAVLNAIPTPGESITRHFAVIDGVTAHLSGAQVLALSDDARVSSIMPDVDMHPTAVSYSNPQVWPAVSELNTTWNKKNAPTIAIVDSGIDTSRGDIAPAQVAHVEDFTGGVHNKANSDGYGHGTFVAAVAAGRGLGYAGASPSSKLISLDVFDDSGNGSIGDVIAAADWIYSNASTYNIQVANFSLTGSTPSSFVNDPLDKAVEALWLKGIVVVAAAGNYHTPGDDQVLYAPANDPFVITVGAYGDNGTLASSDDAAADWSARGHTPDGFAKPEIGAPGRTIWGPVPVSSTMYSEHSDHINAADPRYFWMSGTSFAAPMVSGAAALIKLAHPTWTPDQVKGALMVSAAPNTTNPGDFSYGVGAMKAARAATVQNPPNPNQALLQFVNDPTTTPWFDGDAWETAASGNASWESASWESASWESASWESASWESASWESASWESATWVDGIAPPGSDAVGPDAIWLP